jgi:hypothetical protein
MLKISHLPFLTHAERMDEGRVIYFISMNTKWLVVLKNEAELVMDDGILNNYFVRKYLINDFNF